jgi:HEAT repeat protein
MVRLLVLAFLAAPAAAEDFDKTLRGLREDDRERRQASLDAFAKGEVAPTTDYQRDRTLDALKRFLSDRFRGDERAQAFRALGRLGGDRAFLALLDRLAEDFDDRVLEAAEEVFRKAPEALLDEVSRRVEKAEDPLARAVYVRILGALPGAVARERTRLRAGMPDLWCPRAAAAHALARDRSPEALPPLVALLDSDDPALVTAAIESLTRLTRLDFGRDPAAWKTWWETRDKVAPLDEALARKEGGAGGGEEDGERRTSPRPPDRRTIGGTYFGIPIRGEKVVFVCDVSGSMRYKLELAYDQLARAVKSLPSTARFEVIFFNEHVWPWRGRLCHADPVTKEMLVRYLPTIEIKSYTNLFDGIETALGLGAEEIFVISDGEPNRGRKQFPDDICNEIKRLNTRGTRIHTVSVVRVVDGEEHIALLKRIADENHGQHEARTLK